MTHSMSDKLDALRAKMQRVARSTGGGSFWYPTPGEHMIRILPPVGEMDYFFQEVAKYEFPDGTKFYSAEFTTDGDLPCPVRELVKELYSSNDPGDKELAKKLNSWPIYQQRYWMNVIVRNKADEGGNTGEGPFMFTCPSTVFAALMTLVNSPDYGDISNPGGGTEGGIDVIISRTGDKLNTDYNVFPRRNNTPLHQDPEVVKKWLDAAVDLSWAELSDDPTEDEKYGEGAIIKVMPYERVVKEIGLSPNTNVDAIVALLTKKESEGSSNKAADIKDKLKNMRSETKSQPEDSEPEDSKPEEDAFPVDVQDVADGVGEAIQSAKRERRQRRRR